MVEGDLCDLTLPSLLNALSRERSTAVLRVQRGADQGALYFSEGALVHALAGATAGDAAVHALLEWPDGRFRLVREPDRQPRTITHPLRDFLEPAAGPRPSTGIAVACPPADTNPDEQLLNELLGLLTRLEQDRVRVAEGQTGGGVSALLVVTAAVNALVAFTTTRSTDPSSLPSRVLARLAETLPYTQLLGEEHERITVSTAAALLKEWSGTPDDRRQLFESLCRALLDVLETYGNTISTFFHQSIEREQWRATFDLFVEDLRSAIQQITV